MRPQSLKKMIYLKVTRNAALTIAGARLERAMRGHEPCVLPLHYPALFKTIAIFFDF